MRVRFAPSPTGYLHVGGARTALFNWLFARKHAGAFILRIEDTDAQRSTDEMTKAILTALDWMGLHWDEGPYFQSQRMEVYREAGLRLVASGHAYYCFCSPDALEKKRAALLAARVDPKYDRTCLKLSAEEARQKIDAGERCAVRFRVPSERFSFRDAVCGEIVIESENVEDFVLLRSDGQPTYHLSVVVDDIDMRITHVVRGGDHISNTPKQILLYKAMGADPPAFAHVPLILGPDKTRLSKRHGATSVMAYKEQGILPEAFCNFLALLGWSPGNDQEMFSTDGLIEAFSLEGISKANAVFNPEKLAWFNAQYINTMPYESLLGHLKPEFKAAGLWDDRFDGDRSGWFKTFVDLFRPRAKTLLDFVENARLYLSDEVTIEPAAVEKGLKDPGLKEYLLVLAGRLERLETFDHASLEAVIRGYAEELSVKPALLMNGSRVMLTGKTASPGIFDVMILLGKEKTLSRLRRTI